MKKSPTKKRNRKSKKIRAPKPILNLIRIFLWSVVAFGVLIFIYSETEKNKEKISENPSISEVAVSLQNKEIEKILVKGVDVVGGGEVFLLGANIPAYQNKNPIKSYEPTRARKLLLNKKEKDEQRKDLDITPLEVYNSGRAIKLKIAITRKLKRHDKREKIKKKESDTKQKKTKKKFVGFSRNRCPKRRV